MSAPRCFISYSWDNEPHRGWVLKLATRLRESGVDAILDQFHCSPGIDLTRFMEKSIRESSFVLLVCTPTFAKKADAGVGGVGYEKMIVTGEMFTGLAQETKFVPLLRKGGAEESLPSYLKSRLFIDFREDEDFERKIEDLVRHFYGEPLYSLPAIGPRPTFKTKPPLEMNESRAYAEKSPIIQKLPHPALDAMIEVPAGEFIYQDGKAKIEKPYMIDVYPVTNSQFRKFVEADGYKNPKYWSIDGREWLNQSKVAAPNYWGRESRIQLEHPVVGISFWEAEAYAKWSGKRLPTEKEWERAARGTEGWIYPWGNVFDSGKCNTSESKIEHTTPVTHYPKGVSSAGCYDMAGNVWDWCQCWYDSLNSQKVVRGGSWDFFCFYAEATCRYRYHPRERFNNIGFRCVKTVD